MGLFRKKESRREQRKKKRAEKRQEVLSAAEKIKDLYQEKKKTVLPDKVTNAIGVLDNGKKKKEKITQENYKEKKRQLKFEQAALEIAREQLGQLEQTIDTTKNAIQTELEHIREKIEETMSGNRKCWHKIVFLWIVIIALDIAGGVVYSTNAESNAKEELKQYRQQLADDLEKYKNEVEEKKPAIRQKIEELEQQLKSLNTSDE